jgi:hypothetical protein
MGVFRIMDFRYVPKRSAGPCGLEKESDPELVLRKVIGWQAGSPDDHYDDSHLWYRPTNAGFLGKAKGWASDGWTTGAGALLAPFACAWEAIFGDGCDLDDGAKLAKKYNPVDYVDSWLPGFGDVHGDPYPTLWHFINVDAGGPSQHNAPPGLVYPDAGPSYPGVMDVAIMAGAGLVGLSVHASKSDGVDFYGQYDDDGRGDNAWQAYDIGTIDFSPIDNLARYGWDDKFIAGGSISARGLAWPLHAIGDATAPHHVAGTSSWGHRPYEDYIDQYFDDLVFLLDDIELSEDAAQRQRIGWISRPAPVSSSSCPTWPSKRASSSTCRTTGPIATSPPSTTTSGGTTPSTWRSRATAPTTPSSAAISSAPSPPASRSSSARPSWRPIRGSTRAASAGPTSITSRTPAACPARRLVQRRPSTCRRSARTT